jgi:hypothetical protein
MQLRLSLIAIMSLFVTSFLFGNARLRHRLWMPTLVAVRKTPWLRAHYERLLAAGKRPKVALVACMRKLLTAGYCVAHNRRARSRRRFLKIAIHSSQRQKAV